ncbi:sulfatase-like hydrolase/transferase [Rhodopirellula sp. P2]|uniref:sulfatase-like hydrolase/transferase n=1 Tax=Rhodopirellula sp. P2 TaxID=2127060 RepID=UPI002367F06C|nr:sulfatase-like hydrolase/transferase [Rhodopirellula sp. P2]WDQ18567.1 sulfatase-like hydrolase/transferase [Rhodopirellula sp. P2]
MSLRLGGWLCGIVMMVGGTLLGQSVYGDEVDRPNVILVMADDLGYAQTGYFQHPLLKTPELDRLAAGGLRLDRFYAASAVCSPTRASVLTGRSPERTGVPSHGHALRHQERSIATAIRKAGYVTGHFGKWHLNGLRGPGVPILGEDRFHPGRFGFDVWLSVTNFFDRDPLMSRRGKFEAFEGDSSEVIVEEALDFASRSARSQQPFFAVVWYGTPHSPFVASAEDMQALFDAGKDKDEKAKLQQIVDGMDEESRNHYGELVAMDRSLGTLRAGLERLRVLDNTLIWFCSDNGGLPRIEPSTTAPLRGNKSQLYEGGLRVPCVLHWPDQIQPGRVSRYPGCTTDIAPTLVELLDLPGDSLTTPVDGISLLPVLQGDGETAMVRREKPMGFRFRGASTVVDNAWKLIRETRKKKGQSVVSEQLFQLDDDIAESKDVADAHPEIASRLSEWLAEWNASVDNSVAGLDYPEQRVDPDHPESKYWSSDSRYEAFFEEWRERPEYRSFLKIRLAK